MPIAPLPPEASFVGDGTSRVFPLGFYVEFKSQLRVYVNEVEQTTGWAFADGAVTFATAPDTAAQVRIVRQTLPQQVTEFVRATSYASAGVVMTQYLDADLDRLWMVAQDQARTNTTFADALASHEQMFGAVETSVLNATAAATAAESARVAVAADRTAVASNAATVATTAASISGAMGSIAANTAAVATHTTQIASNTAAISGLGYGAKSYPTLAALTAITAPADAFAHVLLDGSNNGIYQSTGSGWTKSTYDPAQTAINDRKALIDNSTQTDDGIYLLNPLRAALISLHTSTGMRIPGAGIDITPTALAVSGLGLSVAGSKATFGNVGLEITEDGGAAAVVVGKFGQVIYDSSTAQSQTPTPTPTPATSTLLQSLKTDLADPTRSVIVTMIGDSICWGIGATGVATSTPRNKTLDDPRNNYTSKSYANLLRRWLGMMAGAQTGDPAELVPGTFNPANADPLKYSGFAGYRVQQFVNMDTRITKTDGATVSIDAYALSGRALDIPVGGSASLTVYGDQLDILYKTQAADPNSTLSADVNSGTATVVNTYSASILHNNVVTLTAPAIGLNTFRVVNTGTYPLRIQGFRHNRLIALRNNGLSGSSTATWLPTASPSILGDAVPADTTHLLVKLGTNDRGVKGVTNLTDNLKAIVAWLQAARPGLKIGLTAPPKAAPDFDFPGNSAYYYSTGTVRDAVQRVSVDLGLSLLDTYAATARYELTAGSTTSYLLDGLHPNDTGYAEMFAAFTTAITNA